MAPFETVQAHLVDSIKRRALRASRRTRAGEAWLLRGYLCAEENAEAVTLAGTVAEGAPEWLARLVEHQLRDESRHAQLLRARLAELGGPAPPGPPQNNFFVMAKLRWLGWISARHAPHFSAGKVVPLLACAARLEATGVRMFARHVSVLEADERESGSVDGTAEVLRAVLADERRHARSCASALERLVTPEERPRLARLQRAVARVDRSFGVTSSLALWGLLAWRARREGARS